MTKIKKLWRYAEQTYMIMYHERFIYMCFNFKQVSHAMKQNNNNALFQIKKTFWLWLF